jgi:hypothetical protein
VSDKAPNDGPNRDWVRGDGSIEAVPPGIDPGFAYNVGQAHMRGLVPPPLDGPILEPVIAPKNLAPLPDPREEPSETLLPKSLSVQDATSAWNQAIGMTGDFVVISDPTGERIVVDDSFWLGADGLSKITKRGRHRFLRLIAETLRNPDEIWSTWVVDDPSLRRTGTKPQAAGIVRKFVGRFKVEGETRAINILLELGPDGWRGLTAFNSSDKYLQDRRNGVLEYRRK